MRTLQLIEDRRLETVDVAPPPAPGQGDVTLKLKVVALDYDGTVARDDVLEPSVRAAIANARTHGIFTPSARVGRAGMCARHLENAESPRSRPPRRLRSATARRRARARP